jgi:hypothetical protein
MRGRGSIARQFGAAIRSGRIPFTARNIISYVISILTSHIANSCKHLFYVFALHLEYHAVAFVQPPLQVRRQPAQIATGHVKGVLAGVLSHYPQAIGLLATLAAMAVVVVVIMSLWRR